VSRVVVTGGAGFLGSHLCESLLARGDEVVAIDNLLTGSLDNIAHLFGQPGFFFVEHDVTNFVHVSGPVDAVLHFASPASPKDYLEHPIKTLKVGSLGTHKTLGLAKDKGARFLLASTSEVYGDPQQHPQTESYWGHVNPVGPRGVYDEAKRFAEAMTMAYHRFHAVDVRIVRIFNSILAGEMVLYDDGQELCHEPVESVALRYGLNAELDDVRVPAFDQRGMIAARTADAFVGHPAQTACYEVRTRYGRSIRVTGDHSLFVEGPDGSPVARPVRELRRSDRIAIARRIDVVERDRVAVRVRDVVAGLGLDPWSVDIRSEALVPQLRDARHALQALFNRTVESTAVDRQRAMWSRVKGCIDRGTVPVAAVQALGLPIPDGATIRPHSAGPAATLRETIPLNDDVLWLLGLMVAEGCRFERPGRSAFLNISCDEATLDLAAKIIERDLGLHVVRAPASSERGAAIYVHSVLLLRVLDYLGFADLRCIPGWILGLPQARLKWFLEGYRVGDGVHSGQKLLAAERHEFSTVSSRLKDDLIVAFARFGLVPSVGQYASTLEQKTGDRRYPFWRLTLTKVAPWSPLDWDEGVTQTLQSRVYGDLVYASIKAIEEVEPTELVYDFCVPGAENFWAGSGVMAHNTYGPRMRPNDGRVVSNFLVQALEGKPLTIYGDGNQTRSFCYVDDEVRGILALLDGDEVGPVNIGNPGEFTVRELAELVLEVTGSTSEIVYEPLPVDDPTQRRPDITLARARLGWEPKVALREGLERTAPFFRELLERDA
jgi:UDP-glucuronate decarboxylase